MQVDEDILLSKLAGAAYAGDIEQVRHILDQGVSPNADYAINGLKPFLHWAIIGEHPSVVQELLSAGADPDIRYGCGQTALHHAADRRLDDAVRLLVSAGADVSAATPHGETVLHIAARSGASVKCVLDAGADPNARNAKGEIPLHLAIKMLDGKLLGRAGKAARGAIVENQPDQVVLHQEIVRDLLYAGADPNAPDEDGQTPLHYAMRSIPIWDIYSSESGWQDLLRMLIEHGADINLPLPSGELPRDQLAGSEELDQIRFHAESIAEKKLLGQTTLAIVACNDSGEVGQDAIVRPVQRARARL